MDPKPGVQQAATRQRWHGVAALARGTPRVSGTSVARCRVEQCLSEAQLRPTRFTSCSRRVRPLSPYLSFRCFDYSRVRQHGVSIDLRRSCARPSKLPPASPFALAENPACCHAHPFRFLQEFDPQSVTSLDGYLQDVQCRNDTSVQSCIAPPLFGTLLYLWTAVLERAEFQ